MTVAIEPRHKPKTPQVKRRHDLGRTCWTLLSEVEGRFAILRTLTLSRNIEGSRRRIASGQA